MLDAHVITNIILHFIYNRLRDLFLVIRGTRCDNPVSLACMEDEFFLTFSTKMTKIPIDIYKYR